LPERSVRLDLPKLEGVVLPQMTWFGSSEPDFPYQVARIARNPELDSRDAMALRDAAKILEALRIGFLSDNFDREQMTEGELAIERGQQTIAGKLDTIIKLMEKEAEARRIDRTTP
jgi:hypothetical protein